MVTGGFSEEGGMRSEMSRECHQEVTEAMLSVCGSRRHLRGRTALQADTEGVPCCPGALPRLLIVQPSRLRSSLRLFLSLTFSLLVSSSLLPLSPVQQKCLSLEGYTVSNPGQRPGIARGKERLAWRAIRPRRWRREPQREGALCVDEDGLKDHTSLLQADSSLLPATKKIQQF